MPVAVKLQRMNNLMKVIYDDGTSALAYPSGNTLWYVGSGGDVPPDPGSGFKFPYPREDNTTYPNHSGVDWPYASGTDIKSVGDGVVSETYDTTWNTYPGGNYEPVWRGVCVVINHGMVDGHEIFSLYAHMSMRAVNVGDTVTGGQKIGEIGNTGYSDGAHLHFEIDIDGVRVSGAADPDGYAITMAWMDAHTDGSNW